MAIYIGGTGTDNKLDDYEIGTWTPTMNKSGDSGNADSMVTTRSGHYMLVGDLLWLSFYWYGENLTFGSLSNRWYISGVPFNLLTLGPGSSYQFIPGGYNYFTTQPSPTQTYRWQSNSTNGAATITMYGNYATTNATGGQWEWSGCGCLRLAP